MVYDKSYFEARAAAYERNRDYFEAAAADLQARMDELMERRLKAHQEKLRNLDAPPRNDQDWVHTRELLSYLSLSKQSRRQVVNHANVRIDLELYESMDDIKYVKTRLVTISEVETAINTRYGFFPRDFKFKSSEIPDDVVRLINTKADLTNLTFWKEATGEKSKLRDILKDKCSDLLSRWMDSASDRPYSKQEAERLLKDRQYWSM